MNNIPMVPKLGLPLLRRHFVGVPKFTCDVVQTSHGFVRATLVLHELTTICIYSICTTNLRHSASVLFGSDALRLGILHFLD